MGFLRVFHVFWGVAGGICRPLATARRYVPPARISSHRAWVCSEKIPHRSFFSFRPHYNELPVAFPAATASIPPSRHNEPSEELMNAPKWNPALTLLATSPYGRRPALPTPSKTPCPSLYPTPASSSAIPSPASEPRNDHIEKSFCTPNGGIIHDPFKIPSAPRVHAH